MLALILLMGVMPLILAAIGYFVVLYVENFGTIDDISLLDKGMRMRALAYYSFATLPAALISTVIWVYTKSVVSRSERPSDDQREAP